MTSQEQFRNFLTIFSQECRDSARCSQLAQAYPSDQYWDHLKQYQQRFEGLDFELRVFFGLPWYLRNQQLVTARRNQGQKRSLKLLFRLSAYSNKLRLLLLAYRQELEVMQAFWQVGHELISVVGQVGRVGNLRRHVLSELAVYYALEVSGAEPQVVSAIDDVYCGIDLWACAGFCPVQVKNYDKTLARALTLSTAATEDEVNEALVAVKGSFRKELVRREFQAFCHQVVRYNSGLRLREGLLVIVRRGNFHWASGEPAHDLVEMVQGAVQRHYADWKK